MKERIQERISYRGTAESGGEKRRSVRKSFIIVRGNLMIQTRTEQCDT